MRYANTNPKVRGYHLDVYQHVNNTHIWNFLEEARWDEAGKQRQLSVDDGPQYCLCGGKHHTYINYRRPAVLSDLLTVTSRYNSLTVKRRIKRTIRAGARRAGGGGRCITFVCIDLKTQKRCRWKANCVAERMVQ